MHRHRRDPPAPTLMVRNVEQMALATYDLLIIGGGITGACVAWDAALRGLQVALVEKDDFGGATSAATSKLIHGGLRYLREMEFRLVRESLHERRVLESIAPHQVYPIPFLIPTYRGRRGKIPLNLGMIVYELLAYDRARVDDPRQRIPAHRSLSPHEVLEMEPGIHPEGLTGGVLYYDCQVFSPERLTLEFLVSAASRGAHLANYAQVHGFITEGNRLCGACVEDRLTGRRYEIRAAVVVNATGPWADLLLATLPGREPTGSSRIIRSKGIHLITHPITREHAVVLITNEGRHVFLIPWRGHTLLGTTDTLYEGHPDDLHVTEQEIHAFLGEVSRAYPSRPLSRQDVLAFYAGLRPLVEQDARLDTYHTSRRYEITDHREEGWECLLTALGGKYTTSRNLARKLVDRVFRTLGDDPPACQTETTPLHGGNIGIYAPYLQRALQADGTVLPGFVLENLVRSYGSRYKEVVELARLNPELGRPLEAGLPEIGAQIIYAARNEMARTLSDVVFRRTGLGTLKRPSEACLSRTCELMARELGWKKDRRRLEIDRVAKAYRTR